MRTTMPTLRSNDTGAVDTRIELSTQDERTLRRLFEEVYSAGKLHVVEDVVSPDYRGFCAGTGETYRGPAGVKSHATRLRSAFFGLRFDIDDIRGNVDGIEVRWTATGRLERAIMGLQPACTVGRAGDEPGGRELTIAGQTCLQMRNGKVRASDMDWHLDELGDQVGPRTSTRPAGIGCSPAARWASSR